MSVRRLGLMLVSVLIAVGTLSAVVYAAASKPDFTMQISPTSQSVQQNGTATYAVTVSSSNNFSGTVKLAVSGIPKNATGSLSSTSVYVAVGTPGTSTLTVATSTSTAAGTNTITVNGNSGNLSHTVTANLTVTTLSTTAPFTLSVTPGSAIVGQGGQALFTVTATSTGQPSTVLMTAASAPAGPGLAFSPSATQTVSAGGKTNWTLTASAGPSLAAGDYKITITGNSGTASAPVTQTAAVVLSVSTSGKAFGMSLGTPITGLGPGVAPAPMNIAFNNPNSSSLSVTNLTVTISKITTSTGATAVGCTASDYRVTQYGGGYPFAIPTGSSSLSSLRIAQSTWPTVSMYDDPSGPQNGCKGMTVNLSLTGSGSGA